MKAIRFVFCLFAALMLTTFNGLAAEEEDFKTFLPFILSLCVEK